MAKLRIVCEGDNFRLGQSARVWLDDTEISHNLYSVTLDVTAEKPITATLQMYVSELELAVPTKVKIAEPAGHGSTR